MGETTLSHVNTPPAQTWNYLRTNATTLRVPAPAGSAEPPCADVAAIETGAGDEAAAWADAAAAERRVVRVAAGGSGRVDVLVDDAQSVAATDVILAEGAHADVTVTLSPTGTAGTGASILRIRAAEGASVSLVTIVAAPKGASVLDDTGVELADGASLDARHYVVSCDTCALGLAVNLAGASSRADTALRYLVRDGQSLDANYVARMRGRNSRCDLDFSGVLEDGASKTLRDTIDLAHGAKGARGRENETVLLSGDGVTNKSLPVILCDEDDVQGDHGATIGSISPEQARYLADRGLDDADVRALFSRAVVDDAHAHAATGAARGAVREAARVIYGDDVADELAQADPSND